MTKQQISKSSIDQLLPMALQSHQAGDLRQAKEIYRHILQKNPNHSEALFLLGTLYYQNSQHEAAAEYINRAICIDSSNPFYHDNLGAVYQALGRFDKAVSCYYTALALDPDFAGAQFNLGNAFQKQGLLEKAVTCYQKSLDLNPDYVDTRIGLGNALKELGKLDEAINCYLGALALNPNYAEIHFNLGCVYQNQGKQFEAINCFHKALSLKPGYAEAHLNLGRIFQEQDKFNEAVSYYYQALSLKPGLAEVHINLGIILFEQGQLNDAIEQYRKALTIKPDSSEAHNNLGYSLQKLGQLDSAMESYFKALEFNPDNLEAHNNLGNAMRDIGRIEAAAACYHQALKIRQDFTKAYDNLLYLHAFARDISPEAECILAANWENTILNESERVAAHNWLLSFAPPPRAGRKLRLGIVSAELGQHAVAEFLEPALEQFDRTRLHVNLYPTSQRSEPRAERFRKLADEYKSLVRLSDEDAANLIRSDQIDILIDTTGHMSHCRLGIFAHRAAPVQCHYIGYHGTTGLTEMDWFIADESLLPSAYDSHFREKIWRLPRLRLSYRGDRSLPTSKWQPDPEGTVWLGSFNNLAKVREEALGLWAKVLNAIPESRLLLKDRNADDASVQERIRSGLARYGINGERVEFIAWSTDWIAHMALYDKLDIALDTIPLNSETTAFDALWMGVPLIALEGNWYGGRMASAILKSLGKPEWVAKTEADYVAIVEKLARDVGTRKLLRTAQRALMINSPLCDAKGLARALEDAFEKMLDQTLKNGRI